MPRAKTIPLKMLEDMVKAAGVPVKIIEGDNYDVMFSADLALATSGTVTLEAALCGLGSVIVYKTSPITAFIARRVINIPNIGLPNIVAGKRILPELLQEEFTPERLQQEALALLEPERNTQMKKKIWLMSVSVWESPVLYIELQNWFCVLLRRNNDIIFTNFELYKTIYAQTDFCYVLYYYGSSGEFIYSLDYQRYD